MQKESKGEEIVIPGSLVREIAKTTLETQPDKPVQGRSPSSRLFLSGAGDWREVLHNGRWWVVGHHLAYPARNRDDAQRLRDELRLQHKRP